MSFHSELWNVGMAAQDEFLVQMFLLVVNTVLAVTSGAVCQPARPLSFRAAQIYVARKK